MVVSTLYKCEDRTEGALTDINDQNYRKEWSRSTVKILQEDHCVPRRGKYINERKAV